MTRRAASTVLLVLAGVLGPLVVLLGWASLTVFDSETFSQRAVAPLDSQAVRRELASQLTEQLARAGNRQAISFRPGFQLAIEGAIDTDTFRSIFRTSVRRTHESVLAGRGGGDGLDLGDSFAIITSSLQLSGGGEPGAGEQGSEQGSEQGKQGLQHSLNDVSKELDDLGVWELEGTIESLALACLFGSLAAAAGSIVLATDRRRAVRRLGWAFVIGGGAIVLLLYLGRVFLGRQIDDPQLGSAIEGAFDRVTDDLRQMGLWIAVYGIVIAAAAASSGRRLTPAVAWRRARGWVDRRRATTAGTVVLCVLGLLASVLLIQDPGGNLEWIVRLAGLWLGYLVVTEVLRVVRAAATQPNRRARWPRVVAIAGALAVIVGAVTFAFVLTTRSAAQSAEASGEPRCNGDVTLCDLRLDQVAFPGTHNSMSSALYPGFLFGEQIGTIANQLDAGARALLIDTHYGVPSTSRLPGAGTALVLTDQVSAVSSQGEEADPDQAERAARLAARAPRAADARRGIYLCHNRCELGAVEFATTLDDVREFLDTHPDEVIILIIQDETSPADTVAAIEAAGLDERVATLRKGEPLPTLRTLIDEGRTLLVFAERPPSDAPPWYHSAYDWFQETGYTFPSTEGFDCAPNRGTASAPLFLLNHWVTRSPPDPATATVANSKEVLEARIRQCIEKRGVEPNVIAVDFAERGAVFETVSAINETNVEEKRATRKAAKTPAGAPPEATITTPEPVEQLPPPAEATVVTSLTGGDPVRFCPALPEAVGAVAAWAEAVLGSAPEQWGVTDLAYAPLLERNLRTFVDSAPIELAERARPILDRAARAMAGLRALGLDDDQLRALARSTDRALGSAASPDGATVAARLRTRLEKLVDPAGLAETGRTLTADQPDPATLLDLGYVPTEVGRGAGFDCAPVLARI